MTRSGEFVPKAERLESVATAVPEQSIIGQVGEFIQGRLDERDEGGFVQIPLWLYRGAKGSKNQYKNHRARTLAIATGFVMATAMTLEMSASFTASADMNKADTSAEIVKLGWGHGQGVAPVPLYFQEIETGEDIEMDINATICTPVVHLCHDVYPSWADPRLNMQLDGTGQEQLIIPYDAIVARKDGDNVDVTVDWAKVTANIAWTGKGAEVRQYTKSGDTKKFDNQQGLRDNLLTTDGEILRLIQSDTLGNTIDGLKAKIAGDMKQRGLDAFATCNEQPDFIQLAKPKVKDAVVGAIQSLPGDLSVASFRLSHTNKSITIDTGQEAAVVLGDGTYDQSKYLLPSGKFDLDTLDCSPSQPVVNQ